MQHLQWLIMFALITVSGSLAADHDHIGEYYEYDLEGSHADQVKRKIAHRAKHGVLAPFKLARTCYRGTKKGLSHAVHNVEIFLSDSNSIDGKRQEFKRAASQFEAHAAFNDYYVHHNHGEAACMFGLPLALWRSFKGFLYAAGFRFPRAVMREMKEIFFGHCGCVHE